MTKARVDTAFRFPIRSQLAESARTIAALDAQAGLIEATTSGLIEAYRTGAKILAFGNGGSSCDA